jgi:uncharacterized protein (UPF0332 family)
MVDALVVSSYLEKAQESLAGAESEYANGRYNNCANRCYYACFQAAIAALFQVGIQPKSQQGQWGHDFVQSQFIGQLINRQKRYPPGLRDVMERTYILRQIADYRAQHITEIQASRGLRRARQFVETIVSGNKTHE